MGSFWTIGASPTFSNCINGGGAEQGQQPANKEQAALLVQLPMFPRCIWETIDKNDKVLMVLGTLALFFATFGLYRETVRVSDDGNRNARRQARLTRKALKHAEASAAAANKSADAIQRQFVAEHRPWLDFSIEIVGALYHSGRAWVLPVQYSLRHFGRTPATRVDFRAAMLPAVEAPDVEGFDVVAYEMEGLGRLAEAMTGRLMGWGQVIFPEDKPSGPYQISGTSPLFEDAPASGLYDGRLIVIAHVSYGSTFSDDTYATGKTFYLKKRSGNRRIDLNNRTMITMSDDLALEKFPKQNGWVVK